MPNLTKEQRHEYAEKLVDSILRRDIGYQNSITNLLISRCGLTREEVEPKIGYIECLNIFGEVNRMLKIHMRELEYDESEPGGAKLPDKMFTVVWSRKRIPLRERRRIKWQSEHIISFLSKQTAGYTSSIMDMLSTVCCEPYGAANMERACRIENIVRSKLRDYNRSIEYDVQDRVEGFEESFYSVPLPVHQFHLECIDY